MKATTHPKLDLLTAKLWKTYLTAKLWSNDPPELNLNALDVRHMLNLQRDAEFIIEEIERDLRECHAPSD